jgi:trans-aconitate 2-methyltransferase
MAERYNSQMHVAVGGAWQRAGNRLMRQVQIPATTRILDVGCGRGELTLALARYAPDGETIGIDSDPACIEAATGLVAGAGAPNLSFVHADLYDYTPARPFDLVYCNSTLHKLSLGAHAVQRLGHFAAPGGSLAIQLPARGLSEEVHEAIDAALAVIGELSPFSAWSAPWYLPTSTELAGVMSDAGLVEVRAMEEFEPLSFRSCDDAAAYFRGWLLEPYLSALPAAKREDFLRTFGEALPIENGQPNCIVRRVYAIGRRAGP